MQARQDVGRELVEELNDEQREAVPRAYEAYLRKLRANNAMDFDDLILNVLELFRSHPEVERRERERTRYVLVDEYQDTNRAQLDLLIHLAGGHQNVCVVGDDDQCIYSWRGAEVRNILEFEKHFPAGKEVRLEQNYRSTQVILDAANAVIEKNPHRRPKRMWTDRKGGALVQVVSTPNEEEEARWVAAEVKKAIAQGRPSDEIAVLYRVNGQSRFIEEFLREKQVRYEVVGGSEFFAREISVSTLRGSNVRSSICRSFIARRTSAI